jgi:7-keto-8-aminopelargonate synthetase-like enzyme
VDPADIDIMMGTFTKSFGSCGGYIAASRRARPRQAQWRQDDHVWFPASVFASRPASGFQPAAVPVHVRTCRAQPRQTLGDADVRTRAAQARRDVIAHLRRVAPGHHYATSMAPPAAQQIVSALRLLRGEDGSGRGAAKLAALHANSNWFRRRLLELGCHVLGDWDSPVMVRPARRAPAGRARAAASSQHLSWLPRRGRPGSRCVPDSIWPRRRPAEAA